MPDITNTIEPIRPATGQKSFLELMDPEDSLPKLEKAHDISTFASNSSAKFSLECVSYSGRHKRLAATNGKSLITVPVDGDQMPDALFDAGILKKAIRDAGPDGTVQMISVEGTCRLGVPGTITRSAPAGEGRFPDIHNTFPEIQPGWSGKTSLTLSTKELRKLVAYAHAVKAESIKFEFDDDQFEVVRGLRFTFGGGSDLVTRVVGIIMPMASETAKEDDEKATEKAIKEAGEPAKASKPVPNVVVAAAKASNDDKWKKLGLVAMALPGNHHEALGLAGIHTLGELQEKMNRHGHFWAKEIGLNVRFRVPIEDCFNEYLTEFVTKSTTAS